MHARWHAQARKVRMTRTMTTMPANGLAWASKAAFRDRMPPARPARRGLAI